MPTTSQLPLFTPSVHSLTDADIKPLARKANLSLKCARSLARAAEEAATLLAEGDCKADDGTAHNCHTVSMCILPFDEPVKFPATREITIRTQRGWPEKWKAILFGSHDIRAAKDIFIAALERHTDFLTRQNATA